MMLESNKRVVCDGSCSECPRCLMLYICDAVNCGGISAWRTWLGTHRRTKLTAPETISRSGDKVGAHQNLIGSPDLSKPLSGIVRHPWAQGRI